MFIYKYQYDMLHQFFLPTYLNGTSVGLERESQKADEAHEKSYIYRHMNACPMYS